MNELTLIEKRLSSHGGIVLSNLSEIQVIHKKLFLYRDFHVLVYICDQYLKGFNKLFRYKFHICSCKTIEELMNANRFARYVVSTRNDGMFVINTYNIESGNLEQHLFFLPFNDFYLVFYVYYGYYCILWK